MVDVAAPAATRWRLSTEVLLDALLPVLGGREHVGQPGRRTTVQQTMERGVPEVRIDEQRSLAGAGRHHGQLHEQERRVVVWSGTRQEDGLYRLLTIEMSKPGMEIAQSLGRWGVQQYTVLTH